MQTTVLAGTGALANALAKALAQMQQKHTLVMPSPKLSTPSDPRWSVKSQVLQVHEWEVQALLAVEAKLAMEVELATETTLAKPTMLAKLVLAMVVALAVAQALAELESELESEVGVGGAVGGAGAGAGAGAGVGMGADAGICERGKAYDYIRRGLGRFETHGDH